MLLKKDRLHVNLHDYLYNANGSVNFYFVPDFPNTHASTYIDEYHDNVELLDDDNPQRELFVFQMQIIVVLKVSCLFRLTHILLQQQFYL